VPLSVLGSDPLPRAALLVLADVRARAEARDAAAHERDLAALERAQVAGARDRALERRDALAAGAGHLGRDRPIELVRPSSWLGQGAAQQRTTAAEQRAATAEERAAAANDREQAARDRLHAFADREALARLILDPTDPR
jgi:hypothetical protein